MSVPYQNPISSVQVSTPQSVSRTSVFGTNFSVLNVGGYMEVYKLSDLSLTLTASTYPSLIQLSANTIPIRFTKGNNTFLSPDYLTLNSDNISSGRRRLGMLVYVHETDLVYQYIIPNYDTLWNSLTGLTGFSSVTYSDYTTVVNTRSSAGQTFINSWTASTIEGISGYTSTNANWRIFQTSGSTSGLYLPLSGGTVTGPTIFTGGLTANTISATTYQNLPVSGVTGGTGISANTTNGLVTIVNTAPDQIVTLSGGTGISTGGTYPNFVLTNTSPDQIVTLSGGTGISTGGTYPNFVLTNTAPDQIVTITGGTNIGINGTYPNFGINFTGSTGVSGDFLPLSGGTVTGATIFTGGLTANTISATTYQNLPQDIFVTGGTYTSGNAIFTNNSGGTFTVSGFPIGSGGGQIFYLNLSQSQNGNRLLSTTGSTASEQSTGVTINNGVTSTIASFQSQPLNTTLLPGGIWSFYLHSYKQNNNASFNIFVEVYKRTSGGTETLLFATDPTPVTTNSPNPSMQLSDGYFSGTSLSVSDSIVAVVRATNTGNQSHIITLVSEGSQHYSYAVSTIPTQQGLTCDTLSGCSIIQTIQTDVSNKLDKSGGTITGNLIINSGLTATTISATTYQNLPTDIRVTGATYSNNTFTYTNNTGGTFNVLFNTVTGLTINGNLTVTGNTSLRAFTGTSGTVSGSGQNILTVIGSGNSTTSPIFNVLGSNGELFSVSDSLVGSLFSVNDISGLPIVEVFSDSTMLMGSYLAPSLNTTVRLSLTAGTNTIYSIPTSAYTGAFIDYTVINTGSTSARAGNLMTIWTTGTTEYKEVSTNDIGSTTGVTFSTSLSGSNALIRASATTVGWVVKTIIRSI